jgi:hypothetical protein
MVSSPSTGTAYVVDAPFQSAATVMAEAQRLGVRITDILLTHTHWDHTADCTELQRATGARVVVHQADLYRLTDPMKHTIWPLPFTIDPVDEVECITNATTLVRRAALARSACCTLRDTPRAVYVSSMMPHGACLPETPCLLVASDVLICQGAMRKPCYNQSATYSFFLTTTTKFSLVMDQQLPSVTSAARTHLWEREHDEKPFILPS